MQALDEIKEQMLHVCRRIYAREMVASNDGNVTVRVDDSHILATPSGMSKGFLTADDLVLTDLAGNPLADNGRKVTSEIKIYCRIYELRPDVRAAVHAHPIYATACAAAGRTVNSRVLPESVLSLGEVALVPYGTPGTDELAGRVAEYLDGHEVFLLANHGALALGTSVIEAYHRMECLEHTAKIVHLAESLGGAVNLSGECIGGIFAVHGSKTSERIRAAGARMSREK